MGAATDDLALAFLEHGGEPAPELKVVPKPRSLADEVREEFAEFEHHLADHPEAYDPKRGHSTDDGAVPLADSSVGDSVLYIDRCTVKWESDAWMRMNRRRR